MPRWLQVLLQGHYRRSDSDSLKAIGVFPSWGFSEQRGLVTSEGSSNSNVVMTLGPDHTMRLWDANRRVQSRVTILEGMKSGVTLPPSHPFRLDIIVDAFQGLETENCLPHSALKENLFASTKLPYFNTNPIQSVDSAAGFLFPLTPTSIDVSPNSRLIAVGFKGGLWGLWLESAVPEHHGLGSRDSDVDAAETTAAGQGGVTRAWVRLFLTDSERRDEINARLEKLKTELGKARNSQADSYRAVFTDDAIRIKDEIRVLEDESRRLADYTVRGDVSSIRFCPQVHIHVIILGSVCLHQSLFIQCTHCLGHVLLTIPCPRPRQMAYYIVQPI